MNYYVTEMLARQQQREIEENARQAWKFEIEIPRFFLPKTTKVSQTNCCPAYACCAA